VPQVPTLKGIRVKKKGRGQPMNNLIIKESGFPPTKHN